MPKSGMSKFRLSKLRIISLLGAVAMVVLLTASEKAVGTFCNLCPAGFLQITAAARSIPTQMAVGVFAGAVLIVILGRFFCAWLCPSALVKTVRKAPVKSCKNTAKFFRFLPFIILSLALIVSFIVQFPVFCLFCPVGLFFGFIFALFRLFHVYDPSLNLIVFPALLALELLLFSKWCSYICPIAGLFVLFRKIPVPKFFLKVDTTTCLQAQGKSCHVCASKCTEGLEITSVNKDFIERCTTCMECKDHCPTQSIKFKI